MNWMKVLSGLGLLSISALWIAQALALPFPSFARASKVGPAHFPLIVASLLSLLVIVWLVREHRASAAEGEARGWRLAPWYLAYGGYVALTPALGFVPATFFLVGMVVGIKSKGRWSLRVGKAVLSALLITGLEWVIFQKWLGVPLPTGLLGGWGR